MVEMIWRTSSGVWVVKRGVGECYEVEGAACLVAEAEASSMATSGV